MRDPLAMATAEANHAPGRDRDQKQTDAYLLQVSILYESIAAKRQSLAQSFSFHAPIPALLAGNIGFGVLGRLLKNGGRPAVP